MTCDPSALFAYPGLSLSSPNPTLPWLTPQMRGAVADGVTDCTTAFQEVLTFLGGVGGGGLVLLPGTYLISDTLAIPNNVIFDGCGAKIICTDYASVGDNSPLINVPSGNSNIEIRNLTISGGGTWTATPFSNPYGGGSSVGFTNGLTGIQIGSGCTKVRVLGNSISGVENGLIIGAAQSVICDNIISDIGNAAIQIYGASNCKITSNFISGVFGNMTAPGDTSTDNSKFADGVYVHTSSNILISGNDITNCIRIGVVLEGDGETKNHLILVTGNSISNMNSSRGTEYNAAIWFESTKSDDTCRADGNTLYNKNAVAGAHGPLGIAASDGVSLSNNTVEYFGYGITGDHYNAVGNNIKYNSYGLAVSGQSAGNTSSILSNNIEENVRLGISIDMAHGYINVSGNLIRDNGIGTETSQSSGIGLRVLRMYGDQYLMIQGNKFVSSASYGDTTGQIYGVYYVGGGPIPYSMVNLMNNQFIFSGTINAYPTCLGQLPCCMAYDNTSGSVFPYDVINEQFNNNNNTKVVQVASNTYGGGYQRYIGQDTAPFSGTHIQGDWMLNSSPTAGGNIGWVYVASGAWKAFGGIAS